MEKTIKVNMENTMIKVYKTDQQKIKLYTTRNHFFSEADFIHALLELYESKDPNAKELFNHDQFLERKKK